MRRAASELSGRSPAVDGLRPRSPLPAPACLVLVSSPDSRGQRSADDTVCPVEVLAPAAGRLLPPPVWLVYVVRSCPSLAPILRPVVVLFNPPLPPARFQPNQKRSLGDDDTFCSSVSRVALLSFEKSSVVVSMSGKWPWYPLERPRRDKRRGNQRRASGQSAGPEAATIARLFSIVDKTYEAL